ncbi:A-kinase anchor protein 1, mitochondrial-like [Haliotis rubra]|uniref:A-kinase anchor protein 1, mitochondrial-like n=1 Tax=Haliotis rubra TaxID=36100 RepID=UPI001EE572DC|nr:A-kinase anchor protein 1, mitochondrial-like [Haliotis rubra]
MPNLRLVLSIALPSVTALLGFLYFFGRKKDKGKGRKAITFDKVKDTSHEVKDTFQEKENNHCDVDDEECKRIQTPDATHRTSDQILQNRERDKHDKQTANGQKPVSREQDFIKDEINSVCISSVQRQLECSHLVKDAIQELPSQASNSEDVNSSEQTPGSNDKSIWNTPESLPKVVSPSSSSSSSMSSPDESPCPESGVVSQNDVPVSSTGSSDSVHTSDYTTVSASKTLASPRESSQEGVGAKTLNHDDSVTVATDVLSNDRVSDQISVSKADHIQTSKSDPISASNSHIEASSSVIGEPSSSLDCLSTTVSVDSVEVSSDHDCIGTDMNKTMDSSISVDTASSVQSQEKVAISSSAASSTGADATLGAERLMDQNGSAAIAGSSESPSCDSNSEASNDSGRGGSVSEPMPPPMMTSDTVRYEFNFPSELCGRLIGKNGRNINLVKERSGANIALKNNPCTPNFQICVIEGMQSEIDKALVQIRKKFPRGQFPQVDFTPLTQVVQDTPILMPDIMQLNLPEGVSVDIVVSNIVDAGHIFVQQPTHPTFPSLERLNHFMMACYTQDQMVPPLPRPIEVGVICAAFMVDGWFRAQVVNVTENSDEVDIKYVDYGGYARVQAAMLKQIRSDFMTLPFQAVECYMGNVTPLQEEEYFSDQGSTVLEELTQGKLLQAQVINRAEDGIPYIHIYQISGNRVLFINREMVNRKAVRWIEILQ